MSTLDRVIEIATEAHKGQLDKAGRDYIGHSLRVMEMGKTEEDKIVGILHDVLRTLTGLLKNSQRKDSLTKSLPSDAAIQ